MTMSMSCRISSVSVKLKGAADCGDIWTLGVRLAPQAEEAVLPVRQQERPRFRRMETKRWAVSWISGFVGV